MGYHLSLDDVIDMMRDSVFRAMCCHLNQRVFVFLPLSFISFKLALERHFLVEFIARARVQPA
jgi:hypothetical protein